MAEPIYSVTVQFVGRHTRLIETKEFPFTSKDSMVDFIAEIEAKGTETVTSRSEVKAYGRGEFMVALNDLERAKNLPIFA